MTSSAPVAMVTSLGVAVAPAAVALGLELWLPEALLLRACVDSFNPVQIYTSVAFGVKGVQGVESFMVMGVLVLTGVLCLRIAGRMLPGCLVKVINARKGAENSRAGWISALRNSFGNRIALVAVAAAVVLIIAGTSMQGAPQARMVMVAVLNLGIKLLITVQAARIFHCRPWLEAVLTTPLPVDEYVGQQFKWFINRFFPIVAATFLVDLLLAQVPMIWGPLRMSIIQNATLVSVLFLVPDAIVLCLLGFWYGVVNRTINEAAGNVISRVIFLPLSVALFFTAMGLRTETAVGALTLWSVMCLGIDVVLGAWAVWLLKNRLRRAVAEGF